VPSTINAPKRRIVLPNSEPNFVLQPQPLRPEPPLQPRSSPSPPLHFEPSRTTSRPHSPAFPSDWQPTWPASLRGSGQVGGVDMLGASHEVNGCRNPIISVESVTETRERILGEREQLECLKSQEPTHGRLTSHTAFGGQEAGFDAFASQGTAPNIAHKLAQIGDKYLNLNLFGNSDQAKFFGCVLDHVQRQNALHVLLYQRRFKPTPVPPDPDVNISKDKEGKIHMQNLHRIFL